MRMRRKPWARPELAASPFVIDRPEEYKGRWKEAFENSDLPLHIELGCGKGGFIAQKAFETPEINFLALDIKSEVLAVGRRAAVVGSPSVKNAQSGNAAHPHASP